jgi:hypothetical protein
MVVSLKIGILNLLENRISGVMVSILSSSGVGRGLEPWSGQTKGYITGICCFSAKHPALRRKSKEDNVSEWSHMYAWRFSELV